MTDSPDGLRAAIVGAGAVSQLMHVPILAERYDVDLRVLADVDARKARTVADRFGVAEACEPDGVLTREDLDAVVICTPNHLHEAQAIEALEAGKHVYLERPMALTPEGTERVLAAARASGTRLVVGMPHRFRPEASALRSCIAGGEMGDLHSVRGIWLTRGGPVIRPTWRQRKAEAGGGVLMELGIPTLDLCLWLIGYPEVDSIRCVLVPGESEVEDGAIVLARTATGVTLTLEVSRRYFAGHDHYHARVMGSEGSGSLPPLEIFRQLGGRPLEVTPRQPRPRGDENPYTNAYRRQLDYFVRAVTGLGEAPLPEEQHSLMRLVRAAYRSASEGREVQVSEG